MYFKDFDKWNELKKQINDKDGKVYIRAGEILLVEMKSAYSKKSDKVRCWFFQKSRCEIFQPE